MAAKHSMDVNQSRERDGRPKYARDELARLLSERVAFERAAVDVYDAVLDAIRDSDEPIVSSSIDALERFREEEREHAEWAEKLVSDLGGSTAGVLPAAVARETRALLDVIRTNTSRGELLAVFHAMLAAELMDVEGWKVLLEIADDFSDARAIAELRLRVEREDEHLALVRRIVLSLSRDSVRYEGERTANEDVMDVDIAGPARATTDHEKIRRWVEQRGGTPSHVKRTGRDGDIGILRIDFPGWSGERSLEAVDWDTWLRAFDENDLAFVYEETLANGEPSRFNKLVARDTIRRRLAGEHGASVHRSRGRGRASRAAAR